MENLLPEEFRSDFNLKNTKDCFEDQDLQQAMQGNFTDKSSCRQRILSVINEETESMFEE